MPNIDFADFHELGCPGGVSRLRPGVKLAEHVVHHGVDDRPRAVAPSDSRHRIPPDVMDNAAQGEVREDLVQSNPCLSPITSVGLPTRYNRGRLY